MKIAFTEMNNDNIQAAIRECPEIEAVPAASLTAGCEILNKNEADAMVAGIEATTKEVVVACRESLQIVNTYFSSFFLMTRGEEKFILADGGVCKSPDADMLFYIVTQTYESAKKVLGVEPKVAMLSYSSFGSGGVDTSVTKIRDVIRRVKAERPEIMIDGEMQLDTAVNPKVAAIKGVGSNVAGQANVLICPDLNAGNILYKGLEQLGGWTAAGPILQGFSKPVSDLSRGSTAGDVKLVIKTLEKLL